MTTTDEALRIVRERFDSHTVPEPMSGCILWIGGGDRKGYGRFKLRRGMMAAHRAAWILYRGEIPFGMLVCHKCDTPACVNPAHLFIGTAKDNTRDMMRKGRFNERFAVINRTKTACPLGHLYTESNTRRNGRGSRECFTCEKERKRVAWIYKRDMARAQRAREIRGK